MTRRAINQTHVYKMYIISVLSALPSDSFPLFVFQFCLESDLDSKTCMVTLGLRLLLRHKFTKCDLDF